jgi:hypothetical protein
VPVRPGIVSVAPDHHNLSVYDNDADLGERAVPVLQAGTGAGEDRTPRA